MKKIIAFGASNSSTSINQQFAAYAAKQMKEVEVSILDLNDFEMPIYSIDREKKDGIPELAERFKQLLAEHDGYVVSMAEHNGNYTAAFKNIFDWVSRGNKSLWGNKPMLLLSTSPGGRGGASVMDIALKSFRIMGAEIAGHLSLPSFRQNFSSDSGISDPEFAQAFEAQLAKFSLAISKERVSL